MVRRRKLREEYSILWMSGSALILVLSLKQDWLVSLAHAVGIVYPPSFLFLVGILFILLILIHFSIAISKLHQMNKKMAQEIALMKGGTETEAAPGRVRPQDKKGKYFVKVVILAGGFGTRISEESHLKPKPMIEIGERPILWHIMKILLPLRIQRFRRLPRLQGLRDQGVFRALLSPRIGRHLRFPELQRADRALSHRRAMARDAGRHRCRKR